MPETMSPPASPSAINEPLEVVKDEQPEDKLFPSEPAKEPSKSAEPDKKESPDSGEKKEPPAKQPEDKKEPTKSEEPSKSSPEAKPAPVDYESLKLPQGSHLSPDELAEVKKNAKEQGLSLEEAQGVLEVKNDAIKAFVVRQQDALVQVRKEWRDAWNSDPEYGGDNVKKNTELAKRAWDRFADNELKKLADDAGFGDHPAVLRMMSRIGKMISEDTYVRGGAGNQKGNKPPEAVLYGDTTPGEPKS